MTARSDADMSACDRCREQLDDWRRGILAPDAVREIEEHLGKCVECAEELASAEQLGQLLRDSSPASDLPPHYVDDISARVRDRLTQGKVVSLTSAPDNARRRLFAPWWTAAAASILIAAGLAWVVSRSGQQDAVAPDRQVAYYDDADGRSRAAGAPAAAPIPAPAKPTSTVSESAQAQEEAPPEEFRQQKSEISDWYSAAETPIPELKEQVPSASTDAVEPNTFRFDDHRDFARAETRAPVGMAKAVPPAQPRAGGEAVATDALESAAPAAASAAAPDVPEQPLGLAASAASEPQPAAAQTQNLSTRRALDSPSRVSALKKDETAIYQRAEEARAAGRFVEAMELYEKAAKAAPGTATAARSQVRIGELALDHLNDQTRAKAAFSACLSSPLREHLDPATLDRIRARLNSIQQR